MVSPTNDMTDTDVKQTKALHSDTLLRAMASQPGNTTQQQYPDTGFPAANHPGNKEPDSHVSNDNLATKKNHTTHTGHHPSHNTATGNWANRPASGNDNTINAPAPLTDKGTKNRHTAHRAIHKTGSTRPHQEQPALAATNDHPTNKKKMR